MNRLQELLNKDKVCPLDKAVRWELEQLMREGA